MKPSDPVKPQTRIVVHDVNNCLGTIIGLAELVLEDLDSSSPMREDIKDILENAVKASDLTNSLLDSVLTENN